MSWSSWTSRMRSKRCPFTRRSGVLRLFTPGADGISRLDYHLVRRRRPSSGLDLQTGSHAPRWGCGRGTGFAYRCMWMAPSIAIRGDGATRLAVLNTVLTWWAVIGPGLAWAILDRGLNPRLAGACRGRAAGDDRAEVWGVFRRPAWPPRGISRGDTFPCGPACLDVLRCA